MPKIIIEQQDKGNFQFHFSKATSPLIKRKVLNEYYIQAVFEHSARGSRNLHQTDKAKVQSGTRQVIWDENSPPLLLRPDDEISFQLWCTHNPISSGMVATTGICKMRDLIERQGTLDDRERYISLALHPELKPPASPRRSGSPRSPRRSTESGTTCESQSSSRSNSGAMPDSPSELVINIRAIIRDSPKSAQEWNEARQKSDTLLSPTTKDGLLSPNTHTISVCS